MKLTLVWLFAILLCICAYTEEDTYDRRPLQEAARFETDILNGKLIQRAEKAIGVLIRVAAGELHKNGHYSEASSILFEWEEDQKYEFLAFATGRSEWGVRANKRDIGDHKPLSQWLADKYNLIEFLLGVEVCKATHISDLKSLNYSIPVVFRPCSFPMDNVGVDRKTEFRYHFNEGKVYYGLTPVILYWGTYSAVAVVTTGTGFVFVAGLSASIAERLYATFVGPRLSDAVFKMACGQ